MSDAALGSLRMQYVCEGAGGLLSKKQGGARLGVAIGSAAVCCVAS